MREEIQELRIVFGPDGIQYHVTYTHEPDAPTAAGASVGGRSIRARKMARVALHEALIRLQSQDDDLSWLGYSTDYLRTTDSIGLDSK